MTYIRMDRLIFLAILGIISHNQSMTNETETHDETPLPTIAGLRRTLLRQAQDLDRTFQRTTTKAEQYGPAYYTAALKSQVQFRQCLEYLLRLRAQQKKDAKSTNELLKGDR